MSEIDKRRVARLQVSPDVFLDLCKESEWPRVTRVTKNAIPQGAELVGVNYDNIVNCFNMGIRHYSFEAVPINQEPPWLEPVEVTSSLGAYQRMHAELADARDLLRRIRQWDHLDGAGDGDYWKREIDQLIKKPAPA